MRLRISPARFAVLFCVTYPAAFVFDAPMFMYRPVTGTWQLPGESGTGPAMAWYGLMVSAAVAALLLDVLTQSFRPNARLIRLAWLFPVAAIAAYAVFMRSYFA